MDFAEILHEYLLPSAWTALVTLISAVFAFIGAQLKKKYQEKIDTEEKRHVVETCVNAAEMVYKDLKGDEKLAKVKENIVSRGSQAGHHTPVGDDLLPLKANGHKGRAVGEIFEHQICRPLPSLRVACHKVRHILFKRAVCELTVV